MNIIIRKYTEKDLQEMKNIWNTVVEEANSFPQENMLSDNEAKDFFGEQSYTGIADDNGKIVGLYILHPNNVGRCGHIANASYAVKNGHRGKHIGEALVKDSIKIATSLSFRILQFNAVVATNLGAIHLYNKLGFKQLGTIPGGFRMNNGLYEDIIPFIIELDHNDDSGELNNNKALIADMNKKILQSINPIGICESHCNFVFKNSPFSKKAINDINPIGICGNHCEYDCEKYLKECNGCRSKDIGCAFAALFVDKQCPNVTCANENNLNGCYECKKLEDCEIGFFGVGVLFGKASALFIKKYGDECFSKILKKAINTDEEFIRMFFNNGAGNVNDTLKVLEKYI